MATMASAATAARMPPTILPLPLTTEAASDVLLAMAPSDDRGLTPFLVEDALAAGTDVSEGGLVPLSVRPACGARTPSEGLGVAAGREGLAPIADVGVTDGRAAGRLVFLAVGRPPNCEPTTGRWAGREGPTDLEGMAGLR